MNKSNNLNRKIFAAGTVLFLLIVVGITTAYGWGVRANAGQNEEVQKILETGTYQDLLQYRQDTGFQVMPMVKSEEDFLVMQERHTLMKQQGLSGPLHYRQNYGQNQDEGNYGRGFGKGLGQGHGRISSCPLIK